MTTITLAQLAELSGVSTLDIQNWMLRLPLTTKYAKTVSGRTRPFSRDNAVEITFIARLIRSGLSPQAAAERMRHLFDAWKHDATLGWTLFVTDEKTRLSVLPLEKPPSAELLNALDESDFTYILLNAARIIDRVDELFPLKNEHGSAEAASVTPPASGHKSRGRGRPKKGRPARVK